MNFKEAPVKNALNTGSRAGLACLFAILLVGRAAPQMRAQEKPTGIFEGHRDIGKVAHGGTVEYQDAEKKYVLTGGGGDMWGKSDNFQFAWKKISGDAELSADVAFLDKEGQGHRKAVLMVRQGLAEDAAFVDVALHADGLTSLQFRETNGGETHEIQSNVSGPTKLRIVKRGEYVSMWLAASGEKLRPSGAAIRVKLEGAFYVGIGVCSHDEKAMTKAAFSNVELKTLEAMAAPLDEKNATLYSTLETINVASTDRRIVYTEAGHFEAPNWMHDGAAFIFNEDGRIKKLGVKGGEPQTIDTGSNVHCNNDHGISPDGKWLVISDGSQPDHQSSIYILPIEGGTPRRVTTNSPSYWHGWSPDGKTLAYPGLRNGDFDIYTISVDGGEEKRLTTAVGLDDGSEYTPDGKWIYFNSVRTGKMQIWRMHPDGSSQEQVTADEFNNWFAHFSPDGKWMSILSFGKEVEGHPPNKDVTLRLAPVTDDKPDVSKLAAVAKLFGGQGTINVPSWAPDSKQFAFVSYQLVPKD
jgi:TolB protein